MDVRPTRAVAALAVVMIVLNAASAAASIVRNGDARPYDLRIVVTSGQRMLTIDPDATVEDVCPEGCTLTIEGQNDSTYRLNGSERVTIETGRLYFDGPIAPAPVEAEQPAD